MPWDPVCLTPNPNKHQTPIACLGIVAAKTLGTNYPCQCPGHPSPYPHSGSKPNLGPHRNPDSVLHIVLVLHCCYLLDPVSVILVCTLDSFALASPYPMMLYYNVYKDPPSY